MNPKERIQNLLRRLDGLKQPKEARVQELMARLDAFAAKKEQKRIQVASENKRVAETVEEILNKSPRVARILDTANKKALNRNEGRVRSIITAFEAKASGIQNELASLMREGAVESENRISQLSRELEEAFATLNREIGAVSKEAALLNADFETEIRKVKNELAKKYDETTEMLLGTTSDISEEVEYITDVLDRLEHRLEGLVNRKGGGNMNRNIAVSGNQSVLSRFTDVNLIPGSNMGMSYAANQSTGFTDITLFSTASGTANLFASVAGTVNGLNATFTYPSNPQAIVGDGIVYFSGNGYSFAASTISMEIPPSQYIRAIP